MSSLIIVEYLQFPLDSTPEGLVCQQTELGVSCPVIGSSRSLSKVLPLLLAPANVGAAPAKASSCLPEAARPSVMTADVSAQPSHRGKGRARDPGFFGLASNKHLDPANIY